jgi:Protein of unknown function (DUF2806)
MALLPETVPGEKLLLRIWDTLIRDGIGGLLSPWQIRREGRARSAVRAEEMARLAQAEQDIIEIRAGRKCVDAKGNIVSASFDNTTTHQHIDRDDIFARSHVEMIVRETKRQINLSRIVLAAEEEACSDPDSRVAAEQPDPDWLSKWRASAQDVSNQRMQQLWARILSGELKQPGSYSFHALEILSRLSSQDAVTISEIAPYVIDDFVPKDDAAAEIVFRKLLALEELNIVQFNVSKTITVNPKIESGLICNDKVLILDRAPSDINLKMGVHKITKVGSQLLTLGKFKANVSFLERHAKRYLQRGLRVRLADITTRVGDKVTFANARELS